LGASNAQIFCRKENRIFDASLLAAQRAVSFYAALQFFGDRDGDGRVVDRLRGTRLP
jgi:hypothetical protein